MLWCKSTGIFYVGSTIRFFTTRGRITTYFIPGPVKGTVNGTKNTVSKDLAYAIFTYGMKDFTLIIPQEGSEEVINKTITLQWEQLLMLLNPTLNRSFNVKSNDGKMIPEEDRKELSTLFYQYEVDENKTIIADTQEILFCIKHTSRMGILSKNGSHFSIQYDTLKGHLENKMV